MSTSTDPRKAAGAAVKPRVAIAAIFCGVLTLPVSAAPPLAANDWLTGGPTPAAPAAPVAGGFAAGRRPPVAPVDRPRPTTDGPVGVTPIDAPDADRAGILSSDASGLPADLWQGATAATAIEAVAASQPRLPAIDRLLRRLLLSQSAPPDRAAGEEGALFLARVDRLIALGALDLAARLLDSAGPHGPGWQQRRFDVALLSNQDDGGCGAMDAAAAASTPIAARIWCLARGGDWQAASVTLRGAIGLGQIEPGLADRLAAFLDDSQADHGIETAIPAQIRPLDFQLLAASGTPLPTSDLPIAFAWTDLDGAGGWKARVEAAERLARAGSLSGQRLRAIYLEDQPAASGGVWDRVAVIQTLDRAQRDGDNAAVAHVLPQAVAAMGGAGLTAPLAEMFAPDLARMALADPAAKAALELTLYAADILPTAAYDGLSAPEGSGLGWALELARGEKAAAPTDADGLEDALIAALIQPPAAPPTGSAGLAILAAMADIDAGLDGDAARSATGITTLRAFGLDQLARGAVMQILIGPELGARP